MNFKEIQELIKLIDKSELAEFKLKNEDLHLHIKTKHYQQAVAPVAMPIASTPVVQAAPVAPKVEAPAPVANVETPAAPPATGKKLLEIKSPIVGTFYRAPGPEKGPFVKVGDSVQKGQVVCIIEAMKLFNEIESEISGTIVKVCVEDASPVEYDQVLFLVEA